MAELAARETWDLRLTTEELRLVLKSLGGRVASDEEAEACVALGNRLTALRGHILKSIARDGERLVEAADK
jgi:hypothetical protein